MATWFEITFTGEPTEADFERVSELAAQGCTSGQLINEPGDGYAVDTERYGALDPSVKWFVWDQDQRTGQWLVVNEGFEAHCREYAERSMAAAAKHKVTANYVALPEGEEPS